MIEAPTQSRLPHRLAAPKVGDEVVRLEKLHKSFGQLKVLRGIDLSFRYGETSVVFGQSGCGKSVLLKTIIGIIRPDAGRVVVFGRDISELGQAELETLRMNFGMLFQGSALFDSFDVLGNVGFLLYEHTSLRGSEIRDIVRRKLAVVGLEGVEHMMPEELSGGMRKRVALARAIAMDPYIILYDEPTTGLDPVTADTINDLILKTQRELKATTIVVTHDMASANKVADRMVMLHDGHIIIDSTPEGVRASDDPRVQSFIRGDASLVRRLAAQPGGSA
jgi:phospholipid/cholesterol/gamma-HCH transport system ATP-binding protein